MFTISIMNLCSLATLGYIDYKIYKIPNVILCGWLGTTIALTKLGCVTPRDIHETVMVVCMVTGSYIPLRRIARCNAGDFKLFAVLTLVSGVDCMLTTLFITLLITLLPFSCGVEKVPIAFTTYFGYIAFLLMHMEGLK